MYKYKGLIITLSVTLNIHIYIKKKIVVKGDSIKDELIFPFHTGYLGSLELNHLKSIEYVPSNL